MAHIRKNATPRDPRRKHPKMRNDLRRRVFSMNDGVCAICGRELNINLPAGNPLSPELDEIIPIARGGSAYDIDNLQAVHRICNQRKGSKMPGDELPKNINPIPNSREW